MMSRSDLLEILTEKQEMRAMLRCLFQFSLGRPVFFSKGANPGGLGWGGQSEDDLKIAYFEIKCSVAVV